MEELKGKLMGAKIFAPYVGDSDEIDALVSEIIL